MILPEAYARLIAQLDVIEELIQSQISAIISLEARNHLIEAELREAMARIAKLERELAAFKSHK
jgi:hypothetical protein